MPDLTHFDAAGAARMVDVGGKPETARTAQHMLAQETQFKKWYIVHAADHSTLYYGFYTSNDKNDKEHPTEVAEAKRLYDDLNTIRQMQDSEGNRLFSASKPLSRATNKT